MKGRRKKRKNCRIAWQILAIMVFSDLLCHNEFHEVYCAEPLFLHICNFEDSYEKIGVDPSILSNSKVNLTQNEHTQKKPL